MSKSKEKRFPQYKGPLTPEKASQGIQTTLENARSVVDDAELLLRHQRWARACALAILAIEEASKATLILHILRCETQEAQEKAWGGFRSHTRKNAASSSLDKVMHLSDSGKLPEKEHPYPLLLEAMDVDPRVIDEWKQLCLYSDCYEDKCLWSSPGGLIEEKEARRFVALAQRLAMEPNLFTTPEALAVYQKHHRQSGGGIETLLLIYEEFADLGMISVEDAQTLKRETLERQPLEIELGLRSKRKSKEG